MLCIAVHSLEHVGYLERNAFQGCAGDVSGLRAAAQSNEQAAGVRIPVRCAEANECRHEDNTVAVVYGRGKCLDIGRSPNEAKVVAQPLHYRATDEHAALEGIFELLAKTACQRGDEFFL